MDSAKYYLRSESFNWSTGSGQQVVTLQKDKSSSSMLWQVQEAYGEKVCTAGRPVKCGETIRLLHVQTKKRLHSHSIPSVLSKQQEVSAFGDAGESRSEGGDQSDDWKVLCGKHFWTKGDAIRLQHVVTDAFLSR